MSEVKTLHVPFAAFLRAEGIPFVNARPDCESTIAEGHPDFTLVYGNRCLHIEFKLKGEKPRKKQKERIAELESAGNLVLVMTDLAAAMEVVREWKSQIGAVAPIAKPECVDEKIIGGAIWRRSAPGRRYEFVKLTSKP